MAGIDYTTDALVDSVKRRITVPTSQNFFLPSNIVNYANDEMHSTIIPAIISIQEEYFVTSVLYDIVSGQDSYQIPARAVGGMMRDIVLVDSQGNEISVSRLQPETTKAAHALTNIRLDGVVLRDDKVVLYPGADSFLSTDLRIYFMRRPNNLVTTSNAGMVQSFNPTTKEVVLDSVPTSWLVTDLYDIIKGTPTFSSIGDDLALTNLSGSTLTFANLPTDIAVGDYVAQAGFSPIPQVPYEAHHVLAQYTAARMLEAQGDKKNSQVILTIADNMMNAMKNILTPRVEGEMKKINNRSGIFTFTGIQYFDVRT